MDLMNDFIEVYGESEEQTRMFMSPARINIIGEHTDYNGGFVFPCALDFGTYGVCRKRGDNKIKLGSKLFDNIVEIDLDNLEYVKQHSWANYVKGVVCEFIKKGYNIGGFELLIDSDMPLSSGLSSSASLEVLISKILSSLFDLNVSGVDMAIMSQNAENNYMGLKCGIMDQFIIANGEKDKAMLLKCDTLKFEQFKLELNDYKIVICNTKKPRNLIESKYNERLDECNKALEILKKYVNVSCLAEVAEEEFEKYKDKISDITIRNRALHVISETKRTLEASKAMENGNLVELGKYISQSHNSLRDLYEVTGFELDTIVELAKSQDGVLGARMTGAGFGGCAISIVHCDHIDNFIENVGRKYYEKTNINAEFYIASIGNGVREIVL